jgi:cytochrome c553
MTPIAQAMAEDDIRVLASYYAILDAPTPVVRNAARSNLLPGARLANRGNAEKGVPACINCHGPLGTGLSPSVPYLAGQNAGYTTNQLKAWAGGTRFNDDGNVMHAIAAKLSEGDMRVVAEYYQKIAR